ncbi:hypothetical protein, partial [Geobacillus sp.]|uniref:hypothetical protein n=1 Tax=Geobacillus sp. TaxID=1891658 RepID=UPI00257BACB3
GESPFCMTFAFFYRASLGGPDERREQKFATLVGDHFGMSPTNILLTLCVLNKSIKFTRNINGIGKRAGFA